MTDLRLVDRGHVRLEGDQNGFVKLIFQDGRLKEYSMIGQEGWEEDTAEAPQVWDTDRPLFDWLSGIMEIPEIQSYWKAEEESVDFDFKMVDGKMVRLFNFEVQHDPEAVLPNTKYAGVEYIEY